MRALLFGHVVPAAALEWLLNPPEGSAAPDALKQLAVISALRKCKATQSKWGVPAEVLESQWGLSPPSLGAELLALQAAGPLPAGCLQTRIEVKQPMHALTMLLAALAYYLTAHTCACLLTDLLTYY